MRNTDTTDQTRGPLESTSPNTSPTSHLTVMLTPEEIEDLRRDLKETHNFGKEYFKKHPLK